MSNIDFNNLNYEQFETSANSNLYESKKSKMKKKNEKII